MKIAEIYTIDKDGNISKSSVMKGESAYDSAKIGGYTGTEEEFYEKLGKFATTDDVKDLEDSIQAVSDTVLDTDDVNGIIADYLEENGIGEDIKTKNVLGVIESSTIEYGRLNNESSYYFIRIPQYDLEGNKITPKVAVTSSDGSVNGVKKSALDYAEEKGFPIVVNASLFNTQTKKPEGQLVINGVDMTTYKKDASGNSYAWMDNDMGTAIGDSECYPLLIDSRGKLSCLSQNRKASANQPQAIISAGYKYAVTAWGMIVDDYKDNSLAMSEIVHQGKYIRQVIGQFQNGDYFVMSVDKTGYSGATAPTKNEAGANYSDLATFLISKGVRFAYSLDGGGSCETVMGKRQVNPIFDNTRGRAVPSVIYFSSDVPEEGGGSTEKLLTGITATKTKKEYEVGDAISVSDIVVTARYSDGTSKVVTGYTTNVSSISTATSGNKSLIVTYKEGGITETFTITIYVKDESSSPENVLINGEFEKSFALNYNANNLAEIVSNDARITFSSSDGSLEVHGIRTIKLTEIPENVVGVKITTTTAGAAGLQTYASRSERTYDSGWMSLLNESGKYVYTFDISASDVGKYIGINYRNSINASIGAIDCSTWTLEWVY